MRSAWGVAAAVLLAAAVSIDVGTASADSSGDTDARYLLFANTDLWRNGGFAYGGVTWSPGGLDREGFTLKVMLGGGAYRYTSGALRNVEVVGRQLSAAILPGWRFIRDGVTVTAFVGLDLQDHKLTPDDPTAGLRGGYTGLRTGLDLWYEPNATTMIAADGSFSTVGPSYSARVAVGWKLFERYYLGPEVQGFAADGNYRQIRAGLHVTGVKAKAFEWSAGVGWAEDSDHRGGLYGKLGVFTRR